MITYRFGPGKATKCDPYIRYKKLKAFSNNKKVKFLTINLLEALIVNDCTPYTDQGQQMH